MASKKKESEGIALLSMYNDEEDEEMDDVSDDEANEREVELEEELGNSDKIQPDSVQETSNYFFQSHTFVQETSHYSLQSHTSVQETSHYFFQSQSSLPMEESTSPKEDRPSTPTPLFSPPPPPPQPAQSLPPPAFVAQKPRRQALAIVDYAHDETAMSPEAEEGEIMGTGHVMVGEDFQTASGNFQGITPPGTVQILTPNSQGTPPQPSEQPELMMQSIKSTTTSCVNTEPEETVAEETVMASVDMQKDVDPLDNFLPPPPKTMCSIELQEKINKFLALKKLGKSFNSEVRNRKDYRNPDFLLHAVRYQDIDQIGSCFSKDVFDPHGYEKSDFYDELEADMKREMERKEQERKKSQKVEFIAGGSTVGGLTAAQRNNINPVVPTVASTGFHSHPMPADSAARDSRLNKKSKWDKADDDRRNLLHVGGQDALSTAAAHAALLSAANVGAGYTAFAQQKRREAEEKRSSDKRRS